MILQRPNYLTALSRRNRVRGFSLTGGALANRISLAADLGATIRVTDKFRIVDMFRYDGFRIPGNWSLVTANLIGATLLSNPNVFTSRHMPAAVYRGNVSAAQCQLRG